MTGLMDVLRSEPVIVVLNYQYCRALGDSARLDQAVQSLVATFPDDALYQPGTSSITFAATSSTRRLRELDTLCNQRWV